MSKNQHKRFSFGRVLRNVFLLLLLGTFAAAMYVYSDYNRFADAPLAGGTATQVDVPIGMALPGIVNLLAARGMQPGNVYYWRALARQLG